MEKLLTAYLAKILAALTQKLNRSSALLNARPRRLISLFFVIIFLSEHVNATNAPTVQSQNGLLSGLMGSGAEAFLGIPYAKPPTGKLRWRAPQPASHWTGKRDSTVFAHDCMQNIFAADAAPLRTEPSEDCLYLNVWRPIGSKAGDELPVMVWIHGGAFTNGGTSPAIYDGAALAQKGIVFVSFNYRLGRFGFFAHPALSAENADNGLLGNFAILDQIAALRWIQDNIAAFGGDPKAITLMGESAGGGSVNILMASPLARGLFHKAIILSGGGRDKGAARPLQGSSKNAEDAGIAFAQWAGVEVTNPNSASMLRSLPADIISEGIGYTAMFSPAGPNPPPVSAGPMIDGRIITSDYESAYEEGHVAAVPVIVGATTADLNNGGATSIWFLIGTSLDAIPRASTDPFAHFGEDASRARKLYITDKDRSALIATEAGMLEPSRYVAAKMHKLGVNAWQYRAGYVPHAMREKWAAGLPHARELPFVFDNLDAQTHYPVSEADRLMAKTMSLYFINFAKTGNPNAADLPLWPSYDNQARGIMRFTQQGPIGGDDPRRERLDLLESIAQ